METKIKELKARKQRGLQSLPPGHRDHEAAVERYAKALKAYDSKMEDTKAVEKNILEIEEDIKVSKKSLK